MSHSKFVFFPQLLCTPTVLCLSLITYFSVPSEGESLPLCGNLFSHEVFFVLSMPQFSFFFLDKLIYSKFFFFQIQTSIIKHGPHSVTLNFLAFSCSESYFRENSPCLSLNADPLAQLTFTLTAQKG